MREAEERQERRETIVGFGCLLYSFELMFKTLVN